MEPRKTEFKLIYEGTDITTNISKNMISIDYTDNESGKADDLNINIEDRDGKWMSSWFPEKGDKVKFIVNGFDCGEFEVDDISFDGPPSGMSIKAMSVPLMDKVQKNEKKNRAWEKVKFSTVCRDVSSGGVSVDFQSSEDPELERVDQSDQTDLEFLSDLCNKEQLVIKVIKNNVIVLSEKDLEAMAPVMTIIRDGGVIEKYGFNTHTNEIYGSCEVLYFDTEKNEKIEGEFKAPGISKKKDILKINQQIKDKTEAERLAKKSLREKNKDEFKGSLTLMGETRLYTGATVMVRGFGVFDRKYIIENLKHTLSNSGFTTDISIRGCLEGY